MRTRLRPRRGFHLRVNVRGAHRRTSFFGTPVGKTARKKDDVADTLLEPRRSKPKLVRCGAAQTLTVVNGPLLPNWLFIALGEVGSALEGRVWIVAFALFPPAIVLGIVTRRRRRGRVLR